MNKKLLRSVRAYKKQSILAPLLVILEVLMEVLIPLEMAKIIDIGIAQGNLSYILQRGIILVVMAMLCRAVRVKKAWWLVMTTLGKLSSTGTTTLRSTSSE